MLASGGEAWGAPGLCPWRGRLSLESAPLPLSQEPHCREGHLVVSPGASGDPVR